MEIKWSCGGADITDLATSTKDQHHNLFYINFNINEMEDGEVFECRVTSKAFRGKDNKRHSRPISVMPNPGFWNHRQ